MDKLFRIICAFLLATSVAFAAQRQTIPLPLTVERTSAYTSVAPVQASHGFYLAGQQRWASSKDSYMEDLKHTATAGAIGYAYARGIWNVGANFSYEHGERKFDFGWGSIVEVKIKQDVPGFTVFGGFDLDNGWYGKTSFYAGFSRLKFKQFGATDSIHETQIGASLEAGKAFEVGCGVVLTPHLGLDYSHSPQEQYRIYGDILGNPISLRYLFGSSRHFLEIPFGVSVRKSWQRGAWKITPSFDATLVHALKRDIEVNTSPGFVSYNGSEWKTYGLRADDLGGRFKVGLAVGNSRNLDLGVDYVFETRTKYYDHRIGVKAALRF